MNTQEHKTTSVDLAVILAAVDAEPELPDAMPPEMLDAVRNPDTAAEALRIMVRLTKRGIRERILSALSLPPTTSKATVKKSLTVSEAQGQEVKDLAEIIRGLRKTQQQICEVRCGPHVEHRASHCGWCKSLTYEIDALDALLVPRLCSQAALAHLDAFAKELRRHSFSCPYRIGGSPSCTCGAGAAPTSDNKETP